ncbi:helicase [Robertmurraya sp. P23]|uniref:helicase n=1 Tax=Robertmurraya sp. P23 TaxID=3436931 RepID=UPI003D99AAFB
MNNPNEKLFPECSFISRTVEAGGHTKWELIEKLQQSSILINEYGERLLIDDKFKASETKYILQTVELTVGNLGFPEGANTDEIFKKANELGLELCPIELGPYLRLQYLDQPEGSSGNSLQKHQAPSGSITIASEILTEDDDFPKGFYLRRINGELWLRGYRADHLHVWNPDDHFIFCQKKREILRNLRWGE